jgi:SAM-dependent methyltransferase
MSSAQQDPAVGPNAEQVKYWNETGEKWVRFQARIDAQIGPLGRRAMERAALQPGERVLDVGCGCGETSLELARRVGPDGRVVGVDISAPMLARATEAAAQAGARNVTFVEADAQVHPFTPGSFDAVFSRFGVMFFIDPARAFANLRAALRPGGRLAFVCWQELPKNPWLFVALAAAVPYLPDLQPPPPGAPGPFALADPGRLRGILEAAGFRGVDLLDVQEELTLGGGGDLDDAVSFITEGVGPTSAAVRDLQPAVRVKVLGAVRDALAPYATTGGVRLGSAAWIVTAGVA